VERGTRISSRPGAAPEHKAEMAIDEAHRGEEGLTAHESIQD